MNGNNEVTFTNAKFGEVTVEGTSVLSFSEGLPGFERLKTFGIVQVDDEAPFLRLLSVDEQAVGFVVLNPMLIFPDYNPNFGSEDLDGLQIEATEDLEMYCIVTLSQVPSEVTANLKGPIAVNTRKMLARQMILVDDRYTTKHSLLAADQASQAQG
jgi:flagellar assembly factor FliW